MKKYTLALVGLVFAQLLFSQEVVYRKGDWKAGETKVVNGTTINKIEGENAPDRITNIAYQTQRQLIAQLKENKKAGKIGGDRYKRELERYSNFCAGGLVTVFITRETEEACNPKWMSLNVYDKKDEVVFKKDFRDEDPFVNKEGGFKNTSTAFIKVETYLPITIELTEKYGGEERKYIYEIPKLEK